MILNALRTQGHEAYIVGGAVRDHFLGVKPQDIDVATGATPDIIREIATRAGWKTVETGVFFGVVVVVVDGDAYDVATFRTERYGEDSHRPEEVCFAGTLREDLSRRDFTINAMAIDGEEKLIDYYGGVEDLKAKVIRTVGDPCVRFREDALRMFRAARFAATLGFTVDSSTINAMAPNLYRVRGLSVERVCDELQKTLLGEFAGLGLLILLQEGLLDESCRSRDSQTTKSVPILPEVGHLFGLSQHPYYHKLNAWDHTMSTIERIRPEPVLRWAALLHDVAKGLPGVRSINLRGEPVDHRHEIVGAEIAQQIAIRLRLPQDYCKKLYWLVREHLRLPPAEKERVIRWLRKQVPEFKSFSELKIALEQLLELQRADRLAGHLDPGMEEWFSVKTLIMQIVDNVPFYPVQLAVTGAEIAEKLGRGPEVSRFQRNILERIQTGQLDNSREAQIEAMDKRTLKKDKTAKSI